MELSAVILAGGQSRRMGREKAWLEVDGQPLVMRAVARLRELKVADMMISCRADQDFNALGCRVVHDQASAQGPLCGLARAMESARWPRLLVLAVDLPRMTTGFLRRLTDESRDHAGVVPQWEEHLEPLAALYPCRSLRLLEKRLQDGQWAAQAFARACVELGLVRLLRVAPADASVFYNCNTPEDLATCP